MKVLSVLFLLELELLMGKCAKRVEIALVNVHYG